MADKEEKIWDFGFLWQINIFCVFAKSCSQVNDTQQSQRGLG